MGGGSGNSTINSSVEAALGGAVVGANASVANGDGLSSGGVGVVRNTNGAPNMAHYATVSTADSHGNRNIPTTSSPLGATPLSPMTIGSTINGGLPTRLYEYVKIRFLSFSSPPHYSTNSRELSLLPLHVG